MSAIARITVDAPRIEPHGGVFDGVAGAGTPGDIDLQFVRDLWAAALGSGDANGRPHGLGALAGGAAPEQSAMAATIETLLAAQMLAADAHVEGGHALAASSYDGPLQLGANSRYGDAIEAAGRRTGLPPAMLAAIIGAEADSKDGVWDPQSRNPRSTAAGLTQFLSSTWEAEAERPGTWLNSVSARNGWLDDRGRVTAAARPALLELRFNPTAAIEAGADYARTNLDSLAADGLVPRGSSPATLARIAYLAHHLGPADAARFLRGGISEDRARVLLASQIGSEAAEARIAESGSGARAHRAWLSGYVETKIVPERFTRI